MKIQQKIESMLKDALDPIHLEVINESFKHNVPPGSESHFKVVVVSLAFRHLSLLERHRKIYGILSQEMREGVHALSIQAYTDQEWNGRALDTPPCLGGDEKLRAVKP